MKYKEALVIDETTLGTRDSKGMWVPNRRCDFGPLFARPTRLVSIVRWFVRDYLISMHLLYFAVAWAVWTWATPSRETMAQLAPGWMLVVLGRNLLVVIAWFGAWHLRLYRRQAQGTATKYNAKFPQNSQRFTFGSQLKDNVLWSLASGVPIATAFEVIGLWLFSSGRIAWLEWTQHRVAIVAIALLIPIWRELHFYAIHRLIHTAPLYPRVHALHHRNTNPGPWSGLAMHPLEHVAYFSAMAIHWVVASHPVHMIFNQMHLIMAPVPGHAGFEVIDLGRGTFDTHGYAHYLHHKYFEVNYSDGVVPLDRWFGSFHDGSPDALKNLRSKRSISVAGNTQ